MVTIPEVSKTVTRYSWSNIVHAYISVLIVNPRGYPRMSQTPHAATTSIAFEMQVAFGNAWITHTKHVLGGRRRSHPGDSDIVPQRPTHFWMIFF